MPVDDVRSIFIENEAGAVFEHIETMPSKFPTFRILETRPFLFIRLALVDGVRSAWKVTWNREFMRELHEEAAKRLGVGSSMGPFTLTEVTRPERYYFDIDSFFFRGRTGYRIVPEDSGSRLYFDCRSDSDRMIDKIWWYLVRPVHAVLAQKVLRSIKKDSESGGTRRGMDGLPPVWKARR